VERRPKTVSEELLCWRNKCNLGQKENFSRLVTEGWIECCGLRYRIIEEKPNRLVIVYAKDGEKRLDKPEWK
jgi:hypothetical protein